MTDQQKQTCIAIVNLFEGSSIRGNYRAISVAKGDKGHLSYGRSQASLTSGNLANMIQAYCEATGAEYAEQLRPYLPRLFAKDVSLDGDMGLRQVLTLAGDDPVMHQEQDAFFDRGYFQPAVNYAGRVGLTRPLSHAVVYDSCIQGAYPLVSERVIAQHGRVSPTCTEDTWVSAYIAARRAFLAGGKGILPTTVYRMDAFEKLIASGNWELALSLRVRNVEITPESLAVSAAPPTPRVSIPEPEVEERPLLRPVTPYTRGADVVHLQHLLNGAGLKNSEDGIYGPFTQALARSFQTRAGLKADAVVGPQTWRALLDPQTLSGAVSPAVPAALLAQAGGSSAGPAYAQWHGATAGQG